MNSRNELEQKIAHALGYCVYQPDDQECKHMMPIGDDLAELQAILTLIDKCTREARIDGIQEAYKEIMSLAYTYTGEDELSDFCGVDDLSRVSMSWKVDRIAQLTEQKDGE